ncbi:MAG TPA: TIGR03560 family F420-dependent LLM class oxidoreductase [Acidimicrobiales bacterium]|nr:TIGR03560 family F420-dependent LLM class oxidoreductase [Acidimicrobiales bacterium]
MRFAVEMGQHRLEWDQLLDQVRFIEEAGFDGAWIFDHFQPLYGSGPGPCMEAWTLLAALGAATTRVRLGALVTGVTYRHPSILATEVATVDNVSGGRVELGIGAAWYEAEHRQLGIPFPPTGERISRLEEAIDVIRLLLTTDDASYEGRYYRLEGAAFRPRPVQRPTPPVWIGGSGERRMLPLVGRKADAWHCFSAGADYARKWSIVAGHAEKAGRDPSTILRSASLSLSEPWDEVRRRADAHRANGVGYVICSWPSEGRGRLAEFADDVLPKLV